MGILKMEDARMHHILFALSLLCAVIAGVNSHQGWSMNLQFVLGLAAGVLGSLAAIFQQSKRKRVTER
jgi:hypothetical protein